MKAKDWDFTVTLNDGATSGGLVLSDVNHAHHRFARDLRVVRVWVSDMLPTTAKPVATYVLGTPACLATTGLVPTWSPQQTLLAKYPALLEVSASVKTGAAIGSQDDSGPLTITQAYLFT